MNAGTRSRVMQASSLATLLLLASLGARAGALGPASEPGARGPDFATTDGAIALGNLQAQIDSEERVGRSRPPTVAQRSGIAELVALRGQVLGRIADYQRVEQIAEELVRDAPHDGAAYLARASAHAMFHRFPAALEDLDRAERLGADAAVLASRRATILQATGHAADALAQRQRATRERRTTATLFALASAHAELGDAEEADRLFAEAIEASRDVSPFPIALALVQRGILWQREGDLPRARASLLAATRVLPQFVLAQGRLAEVEAGLGNLHRAAAILRPLAVSSDDPDYSAQLARVLAESGRRAESRRWRDAAASRFEELLARHPEAFADHAAEFFLGVGADPSRGLALALRNLEVRRTARAFELVMQAALDAGAPEAACAVLPEVHALPRQWAGLRELAVGAERFCGDAMALR